MSRDVVKDIGKPEMDAKRHIDVYLETIADKWRKELLTKIIPPVLKGNEKLFLDYTAARTKLHHELAGHITGYDAAKDAEEQIKAANLDARDSAVVKAALSEYKKTYQVFAKTISKTAFKVFPLPENIAYPTSENAVFSDYHLHRAAEKAALDIYLDERKKKVPAPRKAQQEDGAKSYLPSLEGLKELAAFNREHADGAAQLPHKIQKKTNALVG